MAEYNNDKSNISELILRVDKPLWLATTGSLQESGNYILGWTTKKPAYDNGFIDKGTVLIFSHSYSPPEGGEALNFLMIKSGSEFKTDVPEFFQKEIESLIQEEALKPHLVEIDIDEMSIVLGNILVKYPGKDIFDERFYSPKDIYIIFGSKESDISNNRIKNGEKISLKRIIEVYSAAVGQNLVLK